GIKIKAKTFALPGLEVGSVIEYRYREVIDNAEANMRLVFQRDIPVRTISYYVKPFSGTRSMLYQSFNVGNTKFEKDSGGFYRATMNNVAAFREEPNMLPEDNVKSWMYIYYVADMPKTADEYWKNTSKVFYEVSKSALKVNDDIKQASEQAIAGATTDDEKLKRLYDYARSQIKNISYSPHVSDEDRKKVKESKTPGDTLKFKMGSTGDIDTLFGAMAKAAGYDVRIALSGDRSELIFDPTIANVSLMLGSSSIAVKVGNDWQLFSPGEYFSPYGMMRWIEEGQQALVTDPKDLIWQKIPLAPSEKSRAIRTGKFKLLEDGTLVGEGRIEYTGHWGEAEKLRNYGDSDAEMENILKNLIRQKISGTAEVGSFTIENANDPDKPFTYTFKVRVPGYALKTGKRLFFQPNVFERNSHPIFTASDRKYDVYIDYPYSYQDNITIEFPDGYSLENADAPAPIKDAQGISSHSITMGVTDGGKTLLYKRNFSFGNGGFIRFPVQSYPAVKGLFDSFNKADVHQLTLKQATVAAAAPSN
ncbi:MAG TPA: transglutaminase domain-containing protein, partial [Pyrinomonadaceae bacterium]